MEVGSKINSDIKGEFTLVYFGQRFYWLVTVFEG